MVLAMYGLRRSALDRLGQAQVRRSSNPGEATSSASVMSSSRLDNLGAAAR
jgi:hypothetical protein